MNSLFLGTYWGSRREPRVECAARLSRFLSEASALDPAFSLWGPRRTKRRPFRATDISTTGIAALLKSNNRDTNREPIVELGFNLGLWNGGFGSFSVTIGAFSPYVGNSVILSFNGESPSSREAWKGLIELAVEIFDPDSAVVTNHDYIARHGDGAPDDAGGWFVYKRGNAVIESRFP